MKRLNLLVLAAGLVAAPAAAIAQSSPAPNNQMGPGVSSTVEMPTDMGLGNESGNTWGGSSRWGYGARETTGFGYTEPRAEAYGGSYGPAYNSTYGLAVAPRIITRRAYTD